MDSHTDYEEASNASGRSSPSPADRRRPWYEILVHNRSIETFEAESNLEVDESKAPINHPYVPVFFNEFEDGTYRVGGIDN